MAQILIFVYDLIIFLSIFVVIINGGMSFFTPLSSFLIYLIHNVISSFSNFPILQCRSHSLRFWCRLSRRVSLGYEVH